VIAGPFGSFDNNNKPLRIRSLRKNSNDEEKDESINHSLSNYAYHTVTCTVEWEHEKTDYDEII
jgi:hypothetical protein